MGASWGHQVWVIKYKYKYEGNGVRQVVTAEPYFYASGNPCACAFALESEAIRENAQFHKVC